MESTILSACLLLSASAPAFANVTLPIAVSQGKVSSDSSLQTLNFDKFGSLLKPAGAGFRRYFMAVRELTGMEANALIVSADFLPKLELYCNDELVDSSTAMIRRPLTTLRLAVHYDITDCRTLRVVKPEDKPQAYKFTASTLTWVIAGDNGDVDEEAE